MRFKRRIIVPVVLVVVALLVARAVNWRTVGTVLLSANWKLVALAGLATVATTVIKGIRWWLFLRHSAKISLGQSIRFTLAGIGVNSIVLANAGEVARVGLAAKAGKAPVSKVLGTLASDKIVEIFAFFTMAFVAALVQPPENIPHTKLIAGAALVLVPLLVIVVWWLSAGSIAKEAKPSGWRRYVMKLRNFFVHFLAEARKRLQGPDAFYAFILSLISWPAQIATYALGAAAVGVKLPLVGTVAAVVAVNLGGIARATPGNVGVFQVMYALAVAPFGVDRPDALAAAVLIQAIQVASAVVAGLLASPEAFKTMLRKPAA